MYRLGLVIRFVRRLLPAFGGQLSGKNGSTKLHALIPCDELVDDYASQFCKGIRRNSQIISKGSCCTDHQARFGLTDEDLVEKIKENPYLQFSIGLNAFQDSVLSELSMIVSFRKRLPEAVINDCKARIAQHGLAVIQSQVAEKPDDDQDGHPFPVRGAHEAVGGHVGEGFWAASVCCCGGSSSCSLL